MKITRFETFLANCGLRNYLFVRLTTDTGLTGIGEATLEWQERTVETLCHEWLEARVVGCDPLEIERTVGNLIRDQYQGGSTVMTAISAAEIALWDIVGKASGQSVYKLLGGRCHDTLPAYANGWYGGVQSPDDFARRAREVVARGYRAMKFDPLGTAWREMSLAETEFAVESVAKVRAGRGARRRLDDRVSRPVVGAGGHRAGAARSSPTGRPGAKSRSAPSGSNCWPRCAARRGRRLPPASD